VLHKILNKKWEDNYENVTWKEEKNSEIRFWTKILARNFAKRNQNRIPSEQETRVACVKFTAVL
jgi:hypothetical protein